MSDIKISIGNNPDENQINGQYTTFDPSNINNVAANRISADNISRPKNEVGLKLPPVERSSIGERSRNKIGLGSDNVRSLGNGYNKDFRTPTGSNMMMAARSSINGQIQSGSSFSRVIERHSPHFEGAVSGNGKSKHDSASNNDANR